MNRIVSASAIIGASIVVATMIVMYFSPYQTCLRLGGTYQACGTLHGK